MKKLLTLLTIAAGLSACSSMSKDKPHEEHHNESNVSPDPSALESNANSQINPLQQIKTPNAVYFKFDDSQVDQTYVALLEANARYLINNPSAKVQISGNTDRIGSAEYNLALGQRRAKEVQDILISQGVPSARVIAISNGSTRPIVFAGNKANYWLNRRADISYTMAPPTGYTIASDTGVPMIDGTFYNPKTTTPEMAQ